MTNVYLTIVNDRYVIRALALYRSLAPHLENKQYWVYCIDDRAADLLEALSLDKCTIVRPDDFETQELRNLRNDRAINEYCWTLKPVALKHALTKMTDLDWGVYLDSDMMVFGDPDDGLRAYPAAQVLITPHRPAPGYFEAFVDTVGVYNAGYVAFRNTPEGHRALSWWQQRCSENCPGEPRNGAYADQRYLNDFPDLFDGVFSSKHKGLNAGPWNILDQTLEFDEQRVFIGGDELLTYHMQGLKILGEGLFDFYSGPVRISRRVRKCIYHPYAQILARAHKELHTTNISFSSPPDTNFWTPISLLREIRKAIRGHTNLYPLL